MRSTDAEIKRELEDLQSKVNFRLSIDSNIGGYQLERIMNAGYGVHPINYYRKSKTEFYIMLLAMNELLDQQERFNKDKQETNEYYKDSHDGIIRDIINTNYQRYDRNSIIDNLNNQLLSTKYETYLIFWKESNEYDDNGKRTKLGIIEKAYGCPSKMAYDTDPIFKVL